MRTRYFLISMAHATADDETLDHVLQALVDSQELQGYEDDPQDEYTKDYAADLTGTTDEGNP